MCVHIACLFIVSICTKLERMPKRVYGQLITGPTSTDSSGIYRTDLKPTPAFMPVKTLYFDQSVKKIKCGGLRKNVGKFLTARYKNLCKLSQTSAFTKKGWILCLFFLKSAKRFITKRLQNWALISPFMVHVKWKLCEVHKCLSKLTVN